MFEDEDPLERLDGYEDLPLYQKGMEIVEVVHRMLELIPDDNQMLSEVAGWMEGDAFTLCVKVAGAEGADIYDIRMENATLIRKAARELVINTHALEMHGFEHTEYFQLIRDLVEEYRLLFIDWVQGFDPWDYNIDRWGLFNPPGVGPHDHDPDDDLPEGGDDL